MSMTEIHGEYRTGKTQLCHTVSFCTLFVIPKTLLIRVTAIIS